MSSSEIGDDEYELILSGLSNDRVGREEPIESDSVAFGEGEARYNAGRVSLSDTRGDPELPEKGFAKFSDSFNVGIENDSYSCVGVLKLNSDEDPLNS